MTTLDLELDVLLKVISRKGHLVIEIARERKQWIEGGGCLQKEPAETCPPAQLLCPSDAEYPESGRRYTGY